MGYEHFLVIYLLMGIFFFSDDRVPSNVPILAIFHQCLRLQAQLLNTTFQQTELECQRDMVKLVEWTAKRDMFASKQAILGPTS